MTCKETQQIEETAERWNVSDYAVEMRHAQTYGIV